MAIPRKVRRRPVENVSISTSAARSLWLSRSSVAGAARLAPSHFEPCAGRWSPRRSPGSAHSSASSGQRRHDSSERLRDPPLASSENALAVNGRVVEAGPADTADAAGGSQRSRREGGDRARPLSPQLDDEAALEALREWELQMAEWRKKNEEFEEKKRE